MAMSPTFTMDQLLDLFLSFNRATWPLQVGLWIATLAVTIRLAGVRVGTPVVAALLAVHWAWNAVAFHALFFSRIYPAAYLLAAMFAFQAVLFGWIGYRRRLAFVWGPSMRHLAGLAFCGAALLYPLLIAIAGYGPPRAPAFGVPAPTTLFSTGVLLLAAPPVPRMLLAAPIASAAIGGAVASTIGPGPDLLILAAIPALLFLALPDAARRRLEEWGTGGPDAQRPMRGDHLVPSPNFSMTLTRIVDAPPADVWPWLAQMGYRRGGLYSYDWLGRLFGYLDAPSARKVLPQFQQLHVGDVISIGRGGWLPVRDLVRCRSLVLGDDDGETQWSWEIALEPTGTQTQIVSRSRARVPEAGESQVFTSLLGVAAFVMTRRMLIGLKVRAERRARESTRPHAA